MLERLFVVLKSVSGGDDHSSENTPYTHTLHTHSNTHLKTRFKHTLHTLLTHITPLKPQ